MDVFYAYPSTPASVGETINAAIGDLRADKSVRSVPVRFKPWPGVQITGKRLITEITNAIDRSEIFACDLTYLNLNVAFELGFAIGRFKRIWISLDTSITNSQQRYKRFFENYVGAGYSGYENHRGLSDAFLAERPWSTLADHLLSDSYKRPSSRPEHPTMLYVKPPAVTDSVIAALDTLNKTPFAHALLIDDPRENAAPTIEWYAEKIDTADAIVVHLLSQEHANSEFHNTKASFVAGLAHGLRKPVLMLAHTPFECPTDYSSLLQHHDTAQNCASRLDSWIASLVLPRRRPRRLPDDARRTALTLELRNISVGEPIAENEALRLDDYFVETSAFYEAQEAQTTIFVGRRGTGKTATLIALEAALRKDKRNHVCVVKPVGYEVAGLLRLLQEDLHDAERGYLIESLWKFLLYTELAGSVCENLRSQPVHYTPTTKEQELLEHMKLNSDILASPFSVRLERAIASLVGLGSLLHGEEQRARISERLHVEQITRIRGLLGEVLSEHNKVALLIDNLDEPWRPGRGTAALSDLLIGLLRVSLDIFDDFHHQDYRQKRVNLCLTVFLRSDIFTYLQPQAAERDKWPVRRVVWNDHDLLLRVIDERLEHALPPRFKAEEIWRTLFPPEVAGLPTRDFIVRNSLPRPRDLIYFVKAAVAGAVNRGHSAVSEQDILGARRQYSQFVFSSVLAEDDPGRQRLETILYEFAGTGREIAASEVEALINRAGVSGEDVDFYVNLLCDVNFLGVQTVEGFRFCDDEDDRRTLRAVAKVLAEERGWGEESYQINPAFFQALQIDST